MTVFLRDMSHFDANDSLAGFVGTTHKVTEGTSYVDAQYARRLNAYHAAGVPILGAYHVLHTGNLAAQLDHWLSTMDALTPWWRDHPHFILQVDAERWPTDNVSPATVTAFARLLVESGAPGFKVTYASRGQYGNSLDGIATPLWNAAYHSSTYPGDGAADWAQYSGRVPTFWQYTNTPFDKNAFRGSEAELLALIEGDDMAGLTDEQAYQLDNIASVVTALGIGAATFQYRTSQGAQPTALTNAVAKQLGALALGGVDLDALAAKVAPLVVAQVIAQMPKPPTAADIAAELAKRLGNG